MRKIKKSLLVKKIKSLCIETNCKLGADVKQALTAGLASETSAVGQGVLQQIIENAKIAEDNNVPLCQDTGFAVFFVELGNEVYLDGFTLQEAIDEGVRQGYEEGYLRKSIVNDPLNRKNTGDNTPAVVHITHVHGDKLKISFAPKGGGAENMSRLKMLVPAQGIEGVKQVVLETVREAGANPCPPVTVGIGIGGTFEKSALLAKKALLRKVGSENSDPFYAKLEKELLEEINASGSGPMGLGGETSALAVFIDTHPCHIASLPVAVNIQCHSARHNEIII